MKFESILSKVEKNNLNSLTPEVLGEFAKNYLENCGPKPRDTSRTENRRLATHLLSYAQANPLATPKECASVLIIALSKVASPRSSFTKNATKLLNKALNTGVETDHYAGRSTIRKSPDNIALEFSKIIKRRDDFCSIKGNSTIFHSNTHQERTRQPESALEFHNQL
ncbi:hypothetical protein [Piscirickettsia litoralis]|uniref:Core-binding (CB) domain-containing protein n=1 Tax=Piscirickettsia litoralis TaxID=1891921 RepID=A0ABX3A3V6_9GAMM|nr:hypothetical protein [Piscirickettsia litoralis]ODN43513.1 hypothetical protein BGC07_12035 [Piscirickettsia litoralis]